MSSITRGAGWKVSAWRRNTNGRGGSMLRWRRRSGSWFAARRRSTKRGGGNYTGGGSAVAVLEIRLPAKGADPVLEGRSGLSREPGHDDLVILLGIHQFRHAERSGL